MRMRALKSIGAFYVNKDSEVFWLDLSVLGFKRIKGGERFLEYFDRVLEWAKEYGLDPEDYVVSNWVMRVQLPEEPPRNALVLVITFSLDKRVIYTVLASFTPGVLTYINNRIKSAGWRREFLFDMTFERITGYSPSSEKN
ncbi:MAG: hypothetical protein ABWK01_00975 [Infirmifilum sp.]